MDAWTIAGFVALIVAVLFLIFTLRRQPQSDLTSTIQGLSLIVQDGQKGIAVVAEKLSRIEPIAEKMALSEQELKVLSERISTVESSQKSVGDVVHLLKEDTGKVGTMVSGELTETIRTLKSQVLGVSEVLTKIQQNNEDLQKLDQRSFESLKRVEMIIAGTHSKGVAGENIVEAIFSKLPPETQERNFRIGGKEVEFAMRLSNDLVLPIDSKWPATNLVEEFESSKPEEQAKIKKEIQTAVVKKAKEVKEYIDPSQTVGFAVAVVPDAVYNLSLSVLPEIYKMNVALVSYSMFLPYILMVFQTVLKTSKNIEWERLHEYLDVIKQNIEAIQSEIDGRFSKAVTMLTNSRDDLKVHLGKIKGSITALEGGALPQQVLEGSSLFEDI